MISLPAVDALQVYCSSLPTPKFPFPGTARGPLNFSFQGQLVGKLLLKFKGIFRGGAWPEPHSGAERFEFFKQIISRIGHC